jgi:hypothetical protein
MDLEPSLENLQRKTFLIHQENHINTYRRINTRATKKASKDKDKHSR